VERGLKTEQRIGPKAYLRPGAAFAGGTLARDIDYLSKLSEKNGLPSVLLNSVKRSNDLHKGWIERTCLAAFKNLRGKKFAFLGLTYKPGTDTLRRSPAIELARTLTIKGASVSAFDPAVKSLDKKIASFISLKSGIKEAVLDCDAVVIMTEWKEFRELKNDEINIIAKRVVIDPNGFLENIFSVRGVRYISVGRAAKEIK
jgi:UDPglucose 6-dehydrogenase